MKSHRITAALILVLGLIFTGSLAAVPRLTSAALKVGQTLPHYSGEVGRVVYRLENPDETAAEVTIQAVPEGASGGALYSRRVTIPAHTGYDGSFPLTIMAAPRYTMQLIHHTSAGDRELSHETTLLSMGNTNPAAAAQKDAKDLESPSGVPARNQFLYGVLAVSEGDFPGVPKLVGNPRFDCQGRFVMMAAGSNGFVPSMVAEYSNYAAVFVSRPEFPKYSVAQMNALRDYVRRGGLLVIAGAPATDAVQDSPLAELMPVRSSGRRMLPDGNLLRMAWGVPQTDYPLRDQFGDLLSQQQYTLSVAAVQPAATVLMVCEGLPLMVIKNYGLGMVLWTAFDPFLLSKFEKDLEPPMWNAFARYSNFVPRSQSADVQSRLVQVQQQLLGYTIPPFRTLGIYLAVYILGAAALLIVGARMKHPALGWGLVCVLGILLTLAILLQARNLAGNQPARRLTQVSLQVWDGTFGPSVSHANLSSRNDTMAKVSMDAQQNYLFPNPEREVEGANQNSSALESSRLLIARLRSQIVLPQLSLQENRPRPLNWSTTSSVWQEAVQGALPVLKIAEDGAYTVGEWKLPRELQPSSRALLLLPSFIQPLVLNGHQIAGLANEAVENDTVLVSVEQYLSALNLRMPAIVLVQIQRKGKVDFPSLECGNGEFSSYDYHLILVPLTVEWPKSETFTVPPALTWFTIPQSSPLSRFYKNGECKGIPVQQQLVKSRLALFVNIYPVRPAGSLQKIRLHKEITMSGDEADIHAALAAENGKGKTLKAELETPSVAEYSEEAAVGFDPLRNRLTVSFQVDAKNAGGQNNPADVSELSTGRTSDWNIRNISAELTFKAQ